jgi:hypothetical protein
LDQRHVWHTEVDLGACYAVYFSAEHQYLISHGELEIVRLSLAGDILWTVWGKDIFAGEFCLYPDWIEVIDFNNEKYQIDIQNGQTKWI